MPEQTFTLSEIKELLPQLSAYELKPGSTIIVMYDNNACASANMHRLGNWVKDHCGIEVAMVGYDGSVGNPFTIYEVAHAK